MPSATISLTVVQDQCLACGVCADVCPTAALELSKDDLAPKWIEAACDGCGVCQHECPTGAITVAKFRA